jgi:predicted nuclease of restriction endonuclease-like (RecB) superfamily
MEKQKNKDFTKNNSVTYITSNFDDVVDETVLFERVAAIIENRKSRAAAYANSEITLMYWEVGRYINSVILDFRRAEYGKKIFATLSRKLLVRYGNSFDEKNLYRMTQFANTFVDVASLEKWACVLSWSHFRELIRIKNDEARFYYADDATMRRLSVRGLKNQISRKAYERREIADTRITEQSKIPFNVFKDPYLLDVLGLKENFLEADLEKAILAELKTFILEFGKGLAFIEAQKRMTMDGDDFRLDLLFYHRKLQRLVAIELKLGKFKPAYMGQMRFYLKWLNRFERLENENAPIGIILCTEASRDQIELLELDKEGIAVAEFWTALPPKEEFERKIAEILHEARERLERRKSLIDNGIPHHVDYFIEQKDDDE